MEFVKTPISGAVAIRHEVRADVRGRFKRQYCAREFEAEGLNTNWLQTNHSVTLGRGSIRGMHFQRPPAVEAKLVSCPFGKAFDVAVDLRAGSATFLKWTALEIDDTTSFYIPEGCAHGFQALTDEVHLIYQHSAAYDPSLESGIRFDDPKVGVEWPLPPAAVSDRDRSFAFIDNSFAGILL